MSRFFPPLFGYSGDKALTVPTLAFVANGRDALNSVRVEQHRLSLRIGPGTRAGHLPLISCLMPTRNRCRQAMFAIECFQRQTWPNRELVILDQSNDDVLADRVRALADDRIQFHASREAAAPLGALRNRTLSLARGEFVCTWDDDDLQHPARLELAMAAMAATHSAASLLAREMMWFPATGRLGVLPRHVHENTMLAPRAIVPPFPEVHRGEDTPVVTSLIDRYPVVMLDLPELYIYVAHGSNTWDRRHLRDRWRSSSDRDAFTRSRDLFARSYPLDDYCSAVPAVAGHAAESMAEVS